MSKKYEEELERECFDTVAKVIELIEIVGWNDDDTYTFANGDRWLKFDPEARSKT